ncbi:MAG: class I SAM-dependent methyltransferase [Chitinophagaceae bacterium]
MARNQWLHWMHSPFYLKFIQAQSPYPSGILYDKILRQLSISYDSRLLMAGCGDGIKALELAGAGYDITGTDYSAELINIAKKSETANLRFFQHDLRLPFWSNYFNVAFITGRSFGTYDTKREHDNLIRTIAGSLLPDGYLILEYINTPYLEQHPLADEVQEIDSTVYDIRQGQDKTHFHSTITVTDPSLPSPEEYVHRKEKFTIAELTGMLGLRGLQVLESFGNDELDKYDPLRSHKLVLLARKTKLEKGDAEKRIYSDGRTTDPLT